MPGVVGQRKIQPQVNFEKFTQMERASITKAASHEKLKIRQIIQRTVFSQPKTK